MRAMVAFVAPAIAGVVGLASACGTSSGDSGSGVDGGPTGVPSGDGGSADGATTPPATGPFAACGGGIVDATGKVDAAEYARQARLWDKATIDCRLGPKFTDLHPGKDDPRPSAYEPPHTGPGGFLCKHSELQGTCSGTCDYGSTSGQVLYAPDDAAATGVDRAQTYAYESGHICESPQQGTWLGGPHPDPALPKWTSAVGHPVLLPNGFSQTEMWETNAGIMIFPDGLVGATGNQNAKDSSPHVQLPAGKVPMAVAVSTYNELAIVAVWDTAAVKGQLAVFALRSSFPEAFSVPYFALPNEAGYQAIHLLGYVDLPDMATPTALAVSGDNGNTPGGHTIGFEFGKQPDPKNPSDETWKQHNILTSVDARNAFSREDYERWMPLAGQVVVASRWENKLTFVDLLPLFAFVRDVYLGPDDAKRAAAGAADVWPYTFDTNPEARPVVVGTVTTPSPTTVRIENQPNGNGKGLAKSLKAWVGNGDGEVRLFDVSGFVHDAPRPVPIASIKEIAKVQAGLNLTSMTLRGAGHVIVTSRGDRSVQWVDVDPADGALKLSRTLRDTGFDDPVVADASDRGAVVTIGDFTGKKLVTYRYGQTENNGGKPPAAYGCGAGGADTTCASFELGGTLAMPGSVFFLGTTNVN